MVLESRNYRLALPVIDKIIFNFPTERSSEADGAVPCGQHRDSGGYITIDSGLTGRISPIMVHEYYMLGALAYIALSKWEEAMLFLELILVSPNLSQANGFMLEAYRKWILLGCIINGRVRTHQKFHRSSTNRDWQVPEIPKSFNTSATRTIKQASRAYDILAEVFQSGDRARLQAEIDAGVGVWSEVSDSVFPRL